MRENNYTLDHSLDLLKDTYFYNHWIYSLLHPYLGETVIEIGPGIGNITRFLLNRELVVGIEPCEEYHHTLKHISETHNNVSFVKKNLIDVSGDDLQNVKFDNVIYLNVLEHIEDDSTAIKKMLGLLAQSGKLLLYVPACNFAYGEIDRNLGHFRRYNKRAIRSLVIKNNAVIEKLHYVNFIGLFGWIYSGKIMKENIIKPEKARIIDRITPYLSAMEQLIHPPLGQSLFAVIHK